MVAACERLLQVKADPKRLQAVDEFLSQNSWDLTWRKMSDLLCSVAQRDLKTPPLEVNPRHADAAQIV
jgi:hypothetical protein